MSEHKVKAKPVNAKRKQRMDKNAERAVKAMEKLNAASNYDPYKVFDSRKGCFIAIGFSILLIVIFVLNWLLNGNWLSLIFVPLYLFIIRNRLRKLRTIEAEATRK